MQLYDSLTRGKKELKPIEPGKIKLYVCGVTVYDYCHIGHARTYLAFDVMVRYWRWRGLEVTYVRNITDIDDKIIYRALENKETPVELTHRFIDIMHQEFDALGILRPDQEPRATQTVDAMIQMIQTLINKNYAYAADNGDVYYHVTAFSGYGKLSGQQLDHLRVGERVDVNPSKKDPLDFVLWKAAKPNEPAWDSPWGPGRPGWHIECSCMTKAALGNQFDIHGGGSDLRFPHHENEIAQSEAANGCAMANYWVHSGMVQVNAEKMSKSLGNFFIIHDVLQQYPAEVVRYFLISGHYRSEINYSDENLKAAQASLARLYIALRDLPAVQVDDDNIDTKRFIAAMDDDFNTPEAVAVLFDLAHQINRLRETGRQQQAAHLATLLKTLGGVLGLLQQDPQTFLQGDTTGAQEINALIAKRNQARADKNWATADQVRDQLTAMNIVLEDGPGGTTWRRG